MLRIQSCSITNSSSSKHLDSHLKPYKCRAENCSNIHFSSTACLLRHEREAHGMHGHGENPHMCVFPECERAMEGHGFPRRWNLHDHMKRVHGYDAAASSPGSNTPSPPAQPVTAGLKKRSPSPKEGAAAKKVKISSTVGKPAEKASQAHPQSHGQGQDRNSIRQVWDEHRVNMADRLRVLGPTNAFFAEQTDAAFALCRSIGQLLPNSMNGSQ